MFTPELAAPEILVGDECQEEMPPKTTQSDTYAFGMMMLQTFAGAGSTPWVGRSFGELVASIYSQSQHERRIVDAAERLPNAPWREQCLGCLNYAPHDRPRMARVARILGLTCEPYKNIIDELLHALREISEGRPARNECPIDLLVHLRGLEGRSAYMRDMRMTLWDLAVRCWKHDRRTAEFLAIELGSATRAPGNVIAALEAAARGPKTRFWRAAWRKIWRVQERGGDSGTASGVA